MTKASIHIRGLSKKLSKNPSNEDTILVFKSTQSSKQGKSSPESYYRVSVSKKLWNHIAKSIEDTSYYIIEGIPYARTTKNGTPFISVSCTNIKAINGLVEDESEPGTFNFPGALPKDTDELVPTSSITIKEGMRKPTTAKNKVISYFQKHRTFPNAIQVKKENMELVSEYASYLLAEELNINMVPVSYNLSPSPLYKKELRISSSIWHNEEEITEVDVKNIVLTEDIHLKNDNFTFRFDIKDTKEKVETLSPIAVRPIEDGKYSLVIGATLYFSAKILDIPKLPAVITDMNHDEFMAKKLPHLSKDATSKNKKDVKKVEGETPIAEIVVPKAFLNTQPNPKKIKDTINYYKSHGKFDKPVVLRGEDNLLIDGYKRYVAAKEMNLDSVWTIKLL